MPTTTKKYTREKLAKLIDIYDALKKNWTKPQEGYCDKEGMFNLDLEDMFDMTHSSMLSLSKVPQDKDFLTLQREDPMSSSLTGVDQKKKKAEEQKAAAEKWKRDLAAQARKMKLDAEVTQLMEVAVMRLEVDGSSSETNN